MTTSAIELKTAISPEEINRCIAILTRWVQLNDLNFNIIYWSAKDKFVHVLYQC